MNYKQSSVLVSKKCIELNKRLITGEKIMQEESGLSKDEWQEFITAFELDDILK